MIEKEKITHTNKNTHKFKLTDNNNLVSLLKKAEIA